MVERARYGVVRRLGKVEVRRYGNLVIAKVDGMGEGGFNHLFRYIQGANRQRAKVAMTAPVISERAGGAPQAAAHKIAMTAPVITEGNSLAFILPDGVTLETAPEPLDGRVTLEEVPERLVAVLRFSGRWTERAFRRRSGELMEELRKEGVSTRGDIFSMLYNPPFTPPFLRRNEVGIEVEPGSFSKS